MRIILLTLAFIGTFFVPAGQLHAGALTTQFAFNNGASGNMFDVNIKSNALTVTSLDLNLSSGTWDLRLYTKLGTFVGSQNNAGAWTLVGSVSGVTSNGVNIATPVNFADFTLLANSTYGFYVTTTAANAGMRYTSVGAPVGSVASSNADLDILVGSGNQYPFGIFAAPRLWNGTIRYNIEAPSAVPEPSSLAVFALGACVFGVSRSRRLRRV